MNKGEGKVKEVTYSCGCTVRPCSEHSFGIEEGKDTTKKSVGGIGMKKWSELDAEKQAEAKKLFKWLGICVLIALFALWIML